MKLRSTPRALAARSFRASPDAELQEDPASQRRGRACDPDVLRRFKMRMDPAFLLGDSTELVEQYRLANATETLQHHAALETPGGEALNGHRHPLDLRVATDEEGWLTPSARVERVANLIHRRSIGI